MKVLNREDIMDILYGGAILGTGGGGSLTKGIEFIDLAISKEKPLSLLLLMSLKRRISSFAHIPVAQSPL